jgi:hypothetical protein
MVITFLNSIEGDAAEMNKIKTKKVYHFVKSYGMGLLLNVQSSNVDISSRAQRNRNKLRKFYR